MRISNKLAGLGAMALLAGCSTLNSINPFASAPKGPQPAVLTELKGTMAVRTAWTHSIGKADAYSFTPAVYNGSVIVAAADGSMARLDGATGRQLWKIKVDGGLTAGVGTDGTQIVVGAAKGMLLSFDMEGKLMWKTQTSSEILSSPVVGLGMVVSRSLDNRIVGFDAKTGERKWTVQRAIPPLTLRAAPGMAVTGKEVVVAQPGGKLSTLTIANGAPRWELTVGEARGATELERVTDIGGIPAIVDKDVCVATYQGRLGCYDAVTGVAHWTKEFSSEVGVGADQRFVFAADDKGALTAYARDTGASAWKNDKLAYRRLSTPVSIGRAVAVGDYQGIVHFFAREDGVMLARANTDASAINSTPVVVGANVIFQTQNGTVAAIAVE